MQVTVDKNNNVIPSFFIPDWDWIDGESWLEVKGAKAEFGRAVIDPRFFSGIIDKYVGQVDNKERFE